MGMTKCQTFFTISQIFLLLKLKVSVFGVGLVTTNNTLDGLTKVTDDNNNAMATIDDDNAPNISTILCGINRSLEQEERENHVDYVKLRSLMNTLFKPERYNPLLRPVISQSQQITVKIKLNILELVSIDDVGQRMVTDCFLTIMWTDELLKWNSSEIGKVYMTPSLENIWKPDITLYNSLEKRDVLGSRPAIVPKVFPDGRVVWGFDSVLTTSCNLNMDTYPFDVQTCDIVLCSTSYRIEDLMFVLSNSTVDLLLMSENYGWDVIDTRAVLGHIQYSPTIRMPKATFTLKMRRKPKITVMNDVLPTVSLSFLNCFVFVVPADSGEKISFGISVLLALAVFVSNTSTRLPSATDGVPALTVYLGLLFINSIMAVVITIVNVRLHQRLGKDNETDDPHSMRSTSPSSYVTQTAPRLTHIGSQCCHAEANKGEDLTSPRCQNMHRKQRQIVPQIKRTDGSNEWMTMMVLNPMVRHSEILGFCFILGIWLATSLWYITYVNFYWD